MADLMDRMSTLGQEKPEEQEELSGLGDLTDTESQIRRNTGDMAPSDRTWFESKLKEIDAAYKGKEEKVERQEAIETIGHAMAQFFAAREGSRRGIDMSGLKFHKTDWDKKLDRLAAKQKEEQAAAKEMFKAGQKEKASDVARVGRYKETFPPREDDEGRPVLKDSVTGGFFIRKAGELVEVDPAQTKKIDIGKAKTPSGLTVKHGKVLTDEGWMPIEKAAEQRKIQPAMTLSELRNYNPEDAKRLEKSSNDYKKELGIGSATSIERVNSNILKAYQMADKNQEETASMLKILMAKGVLGEVGNLAEHDKEGVLATESILAKLKSYYSVAVKGKLTDDQVMQLKEVLRDANAHTIRLQERSLERHRKQFSKDAHISPELVTDSYGYEALDRVPEAEKKETTPDEDAKKVVDPEERKKQISDRKAEIKKRLQELGE